MNITVFLVEDSDQDAQFFRFAAQGRDEIDHIVHFGSGAEALRYVLNPSKEPPDVVVLDLSLPEVSGDEILDVIHLQPTWADVPVVILTGNLDPVIQQRAIEHGAAAYVQKTAGLQGFEEAIEQICLLAGRANRGTVSGLA